MSLAKIRAPKDATSISIGGEEFPVKGGFVELPEKYQAIAETHGYGKKADTVYLDNVAIEAVGNLTLEKVGEMGRGDLLIYCDENHVDIPPRSSLDTLRKIVWDDFLAKKKILAKAKSN